ncbi:unnamed protein product, partial [Chrysoparadoxa australica]
GAEAGTYGSYQPVRDDDTVTLTMPSDTGMYELRYVLREGPRVLASAPIEVTNPEVTVSGPETVATGAQFTVSWTGTVNPKDYVTIVPVGADPDTFGSYQPVRDDSETRLVAPSDTGMYELRYLLREGPKVMATAMIEVTEPQVTVSGPETVSTGAQFTARWTGAVNPKDYVTIVPVGAAENEFGNYQVVRDASKVALTMPADPGMYELRYLMREGPKVLATAMIELTPPEVTVTGPEQIRAGDDITVDWTGTVATNDYINLVPMGAADDKFGTYISVREATSATLKAPAETGLYEVRYV